MSRLAVPLMSLQRSMAFISHESWRASHIVFVLSRSIWTHIFGCLVSYTIQPPAAPVLSTVRTPSRSIQGFHVLGLEPKLSLAYSVRVDPMLSQPHKRPFWRLTNKPLS